MDLKNVMWALIWFAAMGLSFGLILAVASKIFAIKSDPRISQVREHLPGANCGGCGYAGCDALAEAIVNGEAKPSACKVAAPEARALISAVMGQKAETSIRMRAQVMCSGTSEFARKKYIYEGAHDCIAAAKLGGGDKLCPNGCIGLGTCVSVCKFEAIKVINGVSVVDYKKCQGCGMCINACPKHIIKLIPYDSRHWVGCRSVDVGAKTRSYCDVGCISCHMCEKACEAGAIKVNDFVASIDFSKCTGCGKCVEKCPRKIIWSCDVQGEGLVIRREQLINEGEKLA